MTPPPDCPAPRPTDFGAGRRAAVVIASSAASAGRAEDTVGPELAARLRGFGYDCPEPTVVADGTPVAEELTRLLLVLPEAERPHVLITSGGTGIASDDATPEVTAPLLERPLPGIMHSLWSYGLRHVEEAALSRGTAGVRGRTFVVNLPGSPGGARDGMTVLEPLLPHIQAQLEGVPDHADDHRHPSAGNTSDLETGGPGVVEAKVTDDRLDVRAAEAAVTTPQTGAAVTFRGVIRDHDSGRDDVVGLTYSAHPAAQDLLAETVARSAAEHPRTRIWCAHRLGDLGVGDDALVVSVASAHRAEAFACCAAVVDAIKAEVPIWKRQRYADGEHDWVGL